MDVASYTSLTLTSLARSSQKDYAVAGAAIVTDSHQGIYMDSDHEDQVILHDFRSATHKPKKHILHHHFSSIGT